MEIWKGALKSSGLETVDAAPALSALFCAKDEDEIKNIKKAAYLAGMVVKSFAQAQIEGASTTSLCPT